MFKRRGYFRGVLALLLCVFLVSASACPPGPAGPPGPQGPPGPPAPAAAADLVLVPRDVRGGPGITTPAVVAWGAGFTANETISLVLPGNWTRYDGIRITNPPIFATTANPFGAFNVTISSAIMTHTVRVFNLTPGLYSISAAQGVDLHVVASAPLRILP